MGLFQRTFTTRMKSCILGLLITSNYKIPSKAQVCISGAFASHKMLSGNSKIGTANCKIDCDCPEIYKFLTWLNLQLLYTTPPKALVRFQRKHTQANWYFVSDRNFHSRQISPDQLQKLDTTATISISLGEWDIQMTRSGRRLNITAHIPPGSCLNQVRFRGKGVCTDGSVGGRDSYMIPSRLQFLRDWFQEWLSIDCFARHAHERKLQHLEKVVEESLLSLHMQLPYVV